MTDVLSKQQRSQVMAAVKSKGNKATELKLTSILRAQGIHGWRRHHSVLDKPDFVFLEQRLAVFVDGCFWHGCRWHFRIPKSRRGFWQRKISRNKERDREVGRLLRKRGWRVLRVWEHSFREPSKVIARLQGMLAS